jgi:hypothetical protein
VHAVGIENRDSVRLLLEQAKRGDQLNSSIGVLKVQS